VPGSPYTHPKYRAMMTRKSSVFGSAHSFF